MRITIDLETLPCKDVDRLDYLDKNLKPPANYKSKEALDKWRLTARSNMVNATSFDGSAGTICTIGYSIDSQPARSMQLNPVGQYSTEKMLLNCFFLRLLGEYEFHNIDVARSSSVRWVGHNLIDFDLPFLFKRCVILGVDTQGVEVPINQRHGSRQVYDTMRAWNGFQSRSGGSLDNICNALGLPAKGEFDGSHVARAFELGEYDKISEYCEDDVNKTREIYERIINVTGERS